MEKVLTVNDAPSPLFPDDANWTENEAKRNFSCTTLTSEKKNVDLFTIKTEIERLFDRAEDDVLFYFSGHADRERTESYLIAEDGKPGAPGFPMSLLLTNATLSKAKSKLIILDCCHAGAAGNPPIFDKDLALLAEGVTILSATTPRDPAMEVDGHGVFTELLLGGLRGGAADVRGQVSAAALYGYAEAALGELEQRPFYKSHTDSMDPVRLCTPAVPDELLNELSDLFPQPDAIHQMSVLYEATNPLKDPDKVRIFDKLKILRNAGLVLPNGASDLYWCAINNMGARLTALGRYYWKLASTGKFRPK
jgi:hypothetical protein